MTEIYRLSDYGRSVQWATWRTIGGCGLPNNHGFTGRLLPETTLGVIEDQSPATGRSLARFAVERLRMPDLALPY